MKLVLQNFMTVHPDSMVFFQYQWNITAHNFHTFMCKFRNRCDHDVRMNYLIVQHDLEYNVFQPIV
jgi:hypothetical protein